MRRKKENKLCYHTISLTTLPASLNCPWKNIKVIKKIKDLGRWSEDGTLDVIGPNEQCPFVKSNNGSFFYVAREEREASSVMCEELLCHMSS